MVELFAKMSKASDDLMKENRKKNRDKAKIEELKTTFREITVDFYTLIFGDDLAELDEESRKEIFDQIDVRVDMMIKATEAMSMFDEE